MAWHEAYQIAIGPTAVLSTISRVCVREEVVAVIDARSEFPPAPYH